MKIQIVTLFLIIISYTQEIVAQTFNRTNRLVATHRTSSGDFGESVDIEGNTLVVGADGDKTDVNGDSIISGAGAVYIYNRTNTSEWVNIQKLVAPDRSVLGRFGRYISLSGDILAVGSSDAYDENGNNQLTRAGAVYIYERNPATNQWFFVQKLVASDRAFGDAFQIVSLQGNHLLVGAPSHDYDTNGANALNDAGAVYAFERNSTTRLWTETQKIVPTHRHVGDKFGTVIVTKGSDGFVTAPFNGHNVNNTFFGANAGMIYRIERLSNGTWTVIYGFRAPNVNPEDQFGASLDFNNDMIVVGAPGREVTQGSQVYSDAGAIHILDNTPTLTTLAIVNNPIPNFNSRLGLSVAIGLGRIFMGSSRVNLLRSLKEDSSGNWVVDETFVSSAFGLSEFSDAIAIDGQLMAVGAPGDSKGIPIATDTIINSSGSVDIFENCLATRDTIILSRCNDPYTGPSGQYTWASTGVYQDTITNHRGCDSIIEIDLTYNTVDTSVTINGILMTANTVVGTYQWYDCDNQQIIAGATNRSFNAPSNGTYALITSLNGCTDTSACFFINVVGLNDPIDERAIQVYPNPTTGLLLLDWKEVQESVNIAIINPTGQVVQERLVKGQSQAQLNLNELASSWYFIRLQAEGEAPLTVRVRKQ